MIRGLVLAAAAAAALALPAPATAQEPAAEPLAQLPVQRAPDGLVSGQVGRLLDNDAGDVTGFVVSDGSGALYGVTLGPGTEFGLDNAAGDRWVAAYGDDPEEALSRISDQRSRFAPVKVRVSGGVAESVVDREAGDLEQNLGYLFAIYLVTWAGFFAYVFIVSRRQRDLSREIRMLRQQVDGLQTAGGDPADAG